MEEAFSLLHYAFLPPILQKEGFGLLLLHIGGLIVCLLIAPRSFLASFEEMGIYWQSLMSRTDIWTINISWVFYVSGFWVFSLAGNQSMGSLGFDAFGFWVFFFFFLLRMLSCRTPSLGFLEIFKYFGCLGFIHLLHRLPCCREAENELPENFMSLISVFFIFIFLSYLAAWIFLNSRNPSLDSLEI